MKKAWVDLTLLTRWVSGQNALLRRGYLGGGFGEMKIWPIEFVSRTLAAGLLLLYLAARIQFLVMPAMGLWAFDAQDSVFLAAAAEGQTNRAQVDFSLWSQNRIREYKTALAKRIRSPLAVLSVSRIGLRVPVFEGTDELTLNRGAGRIPGTARPGKQGNIAIAAHRDGFFRGLKDIHDGDLIELATRDHSFVYTVDDIKVVGEDDVSVLRVSDKPMITLVTCFPFYFVGSAKQRFIVRGSLTRVEDSAPARHEFGVQK